MAIFLREQDVEQLLTMEDTLAAVEAVFKAQATGEAINEPRRRIHVGVSSLQVMSGSVANFGSFNGLFGQGFFGLKAYTVTRRGAIFHVSLYDAETGELLAYLEADKLGQMRTGAASGVATKYLARRNAKTVGIYGTGWQASSQLEAVCAVREIESVKVYSRSAEKRERFCAEMSAKLKGVELKVAGRPEEAAEADVVITITTAREPVCSGAWLNPGTHLNVAGGNSILRREVDDEAIKRSSFIAVDSLEQARAEAGELVIPAEKGLLAWERVRELRQVVNGEITGRTGESDITLFKSLGIAIEDIATAAVLYRKAREQKAGKEL
ncbi:MAG: ornithine cyclodeaminase family protein [Blastocatellia bacterium]|nr:ornithine cyclodeaminase family protein [Blastocatellia bacterium]